MIKKLEIATNIAVLAVALFSGYLLIRQRNFSSPIQSQNSALQRTPGAEPLKGRPVSLVGVDFTKANPTLVLALSSQCHFCIESTGFYAKLTQLKRQGSIRTNIITAFPQDRKEAGEFLDHFKIAPDQNVSVPLDNLGVSGTPTLLLVGSNGKVQREWIGRLDPDREEEVIRELKGKQSGI